jgi:predicted transposase YbfD/YdcC
LNKITASRTIGLTIDRRSDYNLDAMGTQKAIAQQIIEQKVDYLLALKGNH